MRVLIVDDHAVVRRGLREILMDEIEDIECAEAESGAAALDLIFSDQVWDVVILDLTMPGRGGLDVLKDIRREKPDLPVLILSMHPAEQFAVRALRAGASGYMTKESAPEDLTSALLKIRDGGKYVSDAVAQKLVYELEVGGKPRHDLLSDREYDVFRMIASGKTVSEIGHELSLSVKTISTYRSRIMEKMRMKTNAEIIHYAVVRGLVT
jgi:DNA-binding NarL/FixJ family response regulator